MGLLSNSQQHVRTKTKVENSPWARTSTSAKIKTLGKYPPVQYSLIEISVWNVIYVYKKYTLPEKVFLSL